MIDDPLQQIPLFATLPDAERGEVARLLVPRPCAAGEEIVRYGEPGHEMFVIRAGRCAVMAPLEDGTELELDTLGPGAFFGELSLLDGGPRTATVRALTTVDLLVLDRPSLFAFLDRHSAAARHIVEVLAARQRGTLARVRAIRNVNDAVEERRTRLDRVLDRLAILGASVWFLAGNIAFIGGWIAWSVVTHPGPIAMRDDPPTFFILCFLFGLESILLTMFVLGAQRRAGERDRIRADLDYRVNVEAHREIMALQRKVDRLQALLEARREPGPAGRAGDAPL